jgi:OOP family OmpA-OmpF porin
MSFNLIETAKGLFNNELIGKTASFLGESKDSTSNAILAVIPSIVSGLANKVSTTEGANTIVKLAQDCHQSGVLNNLEAFFGNNSADLINKGSGLLSNLFGSKSDTLTNLVANYSGIKSSSSGTLLSIALPVVLGLLGRHAVHSPAGSSSIAIVLSHQSQHITSVTPSGFNLGSVFSNAGTKIVNTVRDTSAATARYVENAADDTGSRLKWLLPLLILALIAAAAWYFLKQGCNKKTASIVVNADSPINANADSLKNNVTATLGKA